MTRRSSDLRKRLNACLAELAEICIVAKRHLPIWRGQVQVLHRRCGKPTCRCTRGHLHATTILADRSADGRTNRVLTPEAEVLFRKLTERYRDVRQARRRLREITKEMLQVFDELEALRRQEGVRRYAGRLRRRGSQQ